MQLSFLSSSPATLLSTDPTAATKWLGLVPSPDFPSSSASISQSVKWLQWPHARGCEDLLAKGTHIAPSLGEAPLAPYLSLSYQPMWDPAPGGVEVCGEECLLLFNLWVSSGCKGPADCLVTEGNGGIRKLEIPQFRDPWEGPPTYLPATPTASHLPPSRQIPQLLAQPGRAAAALTSHCRWQLVISQASPFH